MTRKLVDVAAQLDTLIGEIGLEKMGAASDDPGTSQPAKQEDARSGIQPASSGFRSAENTADVKASVQGQAVDEATNTDKKGKSDPDVITDATTTGRDPKVERGYTNRAVDPGTSHPAKAGDCEKGASQVSQCADGILEELSKLGSADDTPADGTPIPLTEEEKQAADKQATDWVEGYAKSASLLGELTADFLDGMNSGLQKKAEGEEEMAAMQAAAAGAPGMEGAPQEGGGGAEAEMAALAEAIQQVAAEAGVSPEEVIQALEAQLGEPAGEEMGMGGGMGMEEVAKEASARKDVMQKEAAIKAVIVKLASNNAEMLQAIENADTSSHNAEVTEMKKKADAYDALVAQATAKKVGEEQVNLVSQAMRTVLDEYKSQPVA